MIGRYLKRVLVALDILLNVLLGGEIETMSSVCGKRIVAGQPCCVCTWLCQMIDRAFNGRWSGHCMNNRREPYQ